MRMRLGCFDVKQNRCGKRLLFWFALFRRLRPLQPIITGVANAITDCIGAIKTLLLCQLVEVPQHGTRQAQIHSGNRLHGRIVKAHPRTYRTPQSVIKVPIRVSRCADVIEAVSA